MLATIKNNKEIDIDCCYTFNIDTESVVCSRITLHALLSFTAVIVLIVFTIGKLFKHAFKFKGASRKIEEDLVIFPITAVKIMM